MLKEDLMKEYEEIMIKLALSSAMEIEGEQMNEECKDLSSDPAYAPTRSGLDRVLKSYDKQDRWGWTKHLFSSSVPVFYKAATVLCGILLVVMLTSTSASADKPGFWDFIQSIQQEFATIGGKTEESKQQEVDTDGWLAANWEDGYIPALIPQGFELVSVTNEDYLRKLKFSNGDNCHILFSQTLFEESSFLDMEDAEIFTRQSINGKDAFITEKGNIITITFQQKDYIIKTQGIHVKLETLIKFAEGIQSVQK